MAQWTVAMSFREVPAHEIREVLRLCEWLRGERQRSVARLPAGDRQTVRHYVEAATTAGLDRYAGGASNVSSGLMDRGGGNHRGSSTGHDDLAGR
ncbi:MAG TPA: hypothetical protein VM142_08755 [Acidimicrobiales bacterium]|nr:hypothetical protein [Acidimicrobiales bacterium]